MRCGAERIGHVELRIVAPVGSVDAQLVAEGLGEPLSVQVPARIGIAQRREILDDLLHHGGHLQDQRRIWRRDVVGRAVELRPAMDVAHHGRDPIDGHEILVITGMIPSAATSRSPAVAPRATLLTIVWASFSGA